MLRNLLLALLLLAPSVVWAGGTAYTPTQTCTDVSGTISGNLSGATFDLTIDDITMDDLTCDVATCASFVSTCTGVTCAVSLPVVTGTPTASASNVNLVGDDLYPAAVQPSAGGSGAYTAGASNAIVTGTGDAEFGPALWGISSGDGACAAAGTVDASPDCGQEIASNYGLTCQDVVDLAVITIPVDSACTTLIAAAAKFIVFAK